MVLALKKIFSEHIIKEFVVFNGRLHDVRPALLMGQGQSFPIRVLEAVVKNENERLSVSFPGVLPQDIAYSTNIKCERILLI